MCVLKNAYRKFNLQVYSDHVEVFTVSNNIVISIIQMYYDCSNGNVLTVHRPFGLGSNNHLSASHFGVKFTQMCTQMSLADEHTDAV